jgi:hypothetical protein
MHLFQLRRVFMVVLAATVLLAVPTTEAKRRSVAKSPAGAPLTIDITGTVLDATTNAPVVGARVKAGNTTRTTDEQGKFSFKGVKGAGFIFLEASRTGYATSSAKVTATGDVTLRLAPRATVRVRKTDNTVVDLDDDSLEFGYPVAFSGYRSAQFEDFCRPDGSVVEVDRSEIARINGNATTAQFAPCCPTAPTLKINITLKNGTTSDYYFVDACNGYTNIEVIGRNHTTGETVYIPVQQIGEVIFP